MHESRLPLDNMSYLAYFASACHGGSTEEIMDAYYTTVSKRGTYALCFSQTRTT
jgi:hypothetical protein